MGPRARRSQRRARVRGRVRRARHRRRGRAQARGRRRRGRAGHLARRVARRMAGPDWVEPMLATLSDERDLSGAWRLERKLDGVRCLAFVRGGEAELRSRNRLALTFPEVAAALAPLGDAIVDGEVVAVGDDGHPLGFQALQRHGGAALWAFDLLWLGGEDLRPRPLHERVAALAAAVR